MRKGFILKIPHART